MVVGPANAALGDTHVVTVVGAARQGKSFLMNVLSESDAFTVSGRSARCTQGIDLSVAGLGFADAEGQGDRDVAYDALLVTPALIVSRCVLFNWKGGVERDTILNKLGVLVKAAESVRGSRFGHLHLVFRDWTHVDKCPEAVKNDVFGDEGNARDKIRAKLREAFESISVWLLPPPVVDILRDKPDRRRLRPEFRARVRELRAAIDKQATGRPPRRDLVPELVKELNEKGVVTPTSAYEAIVRRDLEATQKRLFEEAKRRMLRGEESPAAVAAETVAAFRAKLSAEGFPAADAGVLQKELEKLAREQAKRNLEATQKRLFEEAKTRMLRGEESPAAVAAETVAAFRAKLSAEGFPAADAGVLQKELEKLAREQSKRNLEATRKRLFEEAKTRMLRGEESPATVAAETMAIFELARDGVPADSGVLQAELDELVQAHKDAEAALKKLESDGDFDAFRAAVPADLLPMYEPRAAKSEIARLKRDLADAQRQLAAQPKPPKSQRKQKKRKADSLAETKRALRDKQARHAEALIQKNATTLPYVAK